MTSGLDIALVSDMFQQLITQVVYQWNSYGRLCKFSQRPYPKIVYSDYLRRLFQLSECSLQSIAAVLVYMERFTKTNSDLWLDEASLYTLTLVMLLISTKFWDDNKHSNLYFSKVGGISIRLLNEMEIEILNLIDWHLFVTEETMQRYMKQFF